MSIPLPPDVAAPHVRWTQRFLTLGEDFSTPVPATPLPSPYWVSASRGLARELGLDEAWLASDQALQQLTGNAPWAPGPSTASVYSGHQFGQWAGQLGDGRALLLGELDTPQGVMEVQLKGAGRTPYSRMGDGRAVLRSSIREFLASEAMAGLGIPTTRALAVTGSAAPVRRETWETAAVVTRVAPSFIRFGHFEHFAHHDLHGPLRRLADHVIDHHYPECRDGGGHPYARFLEAVSARTANLMAQWQAVGFCHGVMNTDNMSILGLTLDYGPFQFMDGFNPRHICNHSDHQGRYSWVRQPNMAYWNLFCLGQALLPLMDDPDQALAALEPYKTLYPQALQAHMAVKLGLADPGAVDSALLDSVFTLLASEEVDYPQFWRRLSEHVAGAPEEHVLDLFVDRAAAQAWLLQYSEQTSSIPKGVKADLMLKTNPKYLLRNHLAEMAIQQAQQGDFGMVDNLLAVLAAPFDAHPAFETWAGLPPDWSRQIQISCSS